MSDAAFPDRLTQLRAKWEADPTSRVFLQLAEEYRHLGRVQEALAVLDKGLKEHPGYLSALVAKGRCHLELSEGEAARAVLERVVKQDATQMVANKLLVRAYLETGEPAKARERLDLYSLLNDSDPEIEELRRRIKSLDRPVPAEEPRPMDADPFSLPAPDVPHEAREVKTDVFDIDLTPPPLPRRAVDEIFALDGLGAPPVSPRSPVSPASPPQAAAVAVATAVVVETEEEPEGVLFAGLASSDRRRLYLQGLAAEGLFAFELPSVTPAPPAPPEIAEPEAVAPPPPAAVDESAWLEEPSGSTYALAPPEPEEVQRFTAPSAAAEEDLWAEEPDVLSVPEILAAAEPAVQPVTEPPVEPIATATLGELYLRQGHATEAERIFRDVLQREPDNAAARAGLSQLTQPASRAEPEPAPAPVAEPAPVRSEVPPLPPLDARQLLAGYEAAPGETGGSGVTARKVFLLNSYLKRLRGARDVS
jgi:cytochrome c-type biogenesis protein CcmH/NrfG